MNRIVFLALFALLFPAPSLLAGDFEVGPGRVHTELDTVPWESLAPGDRVRIHWRASPYRTKFVLCRQGTATAPITVSGVPDGSGALPVIEGDGAVTPSPLNYWNEDRGVIKIGGANTPPDTMPAHIIVGDLEIRSARPGYSYTGDDGGTHGYASNAAAIYVEKGQNITIRNCILHDCGNGLFAAWQTTGLLVEMCHLFGNGIAASAFEHNNYTEANGITFQFNRFGPLRANCLGNNLKDRSAGTVIRYNWIEGGNRQLDLVDSGNLNTDAKYASTFVYGNILIEPDGAGNSQIVHYGGDSGTTSQYRKGTLHFYNNTVVSTRTGNTTLFRLSTNEEQCDCWNNVFFVTATGDRLALLNADGVLNLQSCWFKPGFVPSHGSVSGTITDLGNHITGTDPGFLDFAGQDFHLASDSPCVNAGTPLPMPVAAQHDLVQEYVVHRAGILRANDGTLDLGAFELGSGTPPPPSMPTAESDDGSCGLLSIEAVLVLLLIRLFRYRRRRR
ncbi:MAG: right-handed parallel beta-helix repeat-containing protein [Planctomycetota bacterium]|jgi:hypothetical protein